MSVEGVPTLLSWSATMFEYLMPSLLMRSFPGTLLETTNEGVVARQIQYGRQRGVPWGISESAYNVRDRHDTYQYRAFGVPGLGFKRGLADDLVIAPYATALALPVAPARGAAEPRAPDRRRRRRAPSATTSRSTTRRGWARTRPARRRDQSAGPKAWSSARSWRTTRA